MSPPFVRLSRSLYSFPRVSGDEPFWSTVLQPLFEFSPRERG